MIGIFSSLPPKIPLKQAEDVCRGLVIIALGEGFSKLRRGEYRTLRKVVKVERRPTEEGIPLLRIETDYGDGDTGQLITRVDAFLATVRQ